MTNRPSPSEMRRVPSPETKVEQAPPAQLPAVKGTAGGPTDDSLDRFYREEQAKVRARAANPVVPYPTPIDKLVSAIAAVMAEIGVVEKGGEHQQQHWKYATIGNILQVLTPLMGKHGVAVFQNEGKPQFDKQHVIVPYEFTVAHSSGQTFPEKIRKSGMSLALLNSGKWDDKCLNKASTAARKNFLLELFQVPTGDIADADAGEEPVKARTIPGPIDARSLYPGTSSQSDADPTLAEVSWKVPAQGLDAKGWALAYIRRLDDCKLATDIAEMETNNEKALDSLYKHEDLFRMVSEASQRRLAIITGATDTDGVVQEGEPASEVVIERDPTMPDPAGNPEELIAWIRTKFEGLKTIEELLVVWENQIMPVADAILAPDFEIIQGLFDETEKRFAP